ncbi:MAG: type II secretion system F family protein [Planctomycetes bacterium]|nr:type II secretion system F family protein [Planctomycetota bacterium]
MNLSYEAIDRSGRTISDLFQADSIKAAVEQLRERGLMVTQISQASQHEVARKAREEEATGSKIKLPLKLLVAFTRQMAMLLTSGSSVVDALGAIARQLKDPAHVRLVEQIRTDLEEGAALAVALRKWPKTFDASYTAVIAAGEASATLPDMFDRLAKIVGSRRAVRNKVIGAMIYPALLVQLCVATMGIMLFFVLPRFGDMFSSLGVPLPASTRFLLALSAFLVKYWLALAAVTTLAIGSATYLILHPAGRQWCANVQIRLPILGKVLSSLIQGQIFRTLGMLLEAKVSVLDSLDLVRETTKARQFQALFDLIDNAVTSGSQMSDALEASGLIDAAICQAVRTGESSGNLGGAMSYAADVLEEDNVELVQTATKLLEPTILIAMGLVVGTVAVSLFMPLFDITSMVN